MEVIKVSPRGYCSGVVDALQVVQQAVKDTRVPRPIHILGQIIHNCHAVEALVALGVITLDGSDRVDLLEQVTGGTVIFTAHGVSPLVKAHVTTTYTRDVQATVARLFYLSDGAPGPVNLGRTRKSGVPHSLDQQRGTEPGSARAFLRGVSLPLLSQREVS